MRQVAENMLHENRIRCRGALRPRCGLNHRLRDHEARVIHISLGLIREASPAPAAR